ncbi:MAG: hypothetical protein JXJ04_22765 [Spirochaetales bacterium]|nr:hypothetical protein [Spirochaetales bacterium]
MKNNSILIFIIFALLQGVSTFSVFPQPGEIRVKEEWKILMDELGIVTNNPGTTENAIVEFINNILDPIISFFSFLFHARSILIFPLVLILIFIIGYAGLKFFTNVRRERNKDYSLITRNVPSSKELTREFFSHYIDDARECAEKGEYGEALVFLHKASIVYLRIKRILSGGVYNTNKEIRQELKSQNRYYESFTRLAGIAERKAFRSELITKELYNEYLVLFNHNFTLNDEN